MLMVFISIFFSACGHLSVEFEASGRRSCRQAVSPEALTWGKLKTCCRAERNKDAHHTFQGFCLVLGLGVQRAGRNWV